ncbi:MAG: hypothetical protein WCG48_00860 [Candidatus Berkelbacteria bacterium]
MKLSKLLVYFLIVVLTAVIFACVGFFVSKNDLNFENHFGLKKITTISGVGAEGDELFTIEHPANMSIQCPGYGDYSCTFPTGNPAVQGVSATKLMSTDRRDQTPYINFELYRKDEIGFDASAYEKNALSNNSNAVSGFETKTLGNVTLYYFNEDNKRKDDEGSIENVSEADKVAVVFLRDHSFVVKITHVAKKIDGRDIGFSTINFDEATFQKIISTMTEISYT